MKRVWIGGLAFLGGVLLTFWLMSEPEVQQTQGFAMPSQPRISEGPARSLNEATETPSIARPPLPDSNVETAIDVGPAISATNSAAVDAVPILPGIELSGDIQMFHGILEEEVRDELWAVPMETELYNYFFENSPELANNFGVPTVVCRTTICEVQAIGYGQGSLEAWQTATSDLDSQPWAEEFIQVQLGGNQISPDTEGLVLVLVRTSGDTTVQSIGEAVATI